MKGSIIKLCYILIGIFFIIIILWPIHQVYNPKDPLFKKFNPANAMSDIETQLSFGPRYPGSSGHQKEIDWINNQLTQIGWQTEEQSFFYQQMKITNLLAKNDAKGNLILIGAHYDTRQYADQDLNIDYRNAPVPGANDGASGVAVLLELARILVNDHKNTYWLLFFDAEDKGQIQGWDWIIGSSQFAQSLNVKPNDVIIVDMIGDQNLNIYKEGFSDQKIQSDLWKSASNLGYSKYFKPEMKYYMIDDQKPFSDKGIPSALLIDFEYPYWHTTEDTIDKISPNSLQIVGSTILEWLKSKK